MYINNIFNFGTHLCFGLFSSKHLPARKCHSIFRFKQILEQEKKNTFKVFQSTSKDHEMALDVIKSCFLPEHVMVRAHNLDLDDRSLDQYLLGLFKQGNTLYAKAEDGSIAGLCVNFASGVVDPKNLRTYAYYRQDLKIKDFLCFLAKLQETPNLWDVFKQPKIFEIKMLTVLPQYRRQGLAVLLAEKSREHAILQGYNVIRMDCINPYDHKIAERCGFECLMKFPLHKLRGPTAPYIKRNSEYNCCARVYVDARTHRDTINRCTIKQMKEDLESLIE